MKCMKSDAFVHLHVVRITYRAANTYSYFVTRMRDFTGPTKFEVARILHYVLEGIAKFAAD